MKHISYGASLTGSSGINGDAFYISPDRKVFVLADGASGSGRDGKVIMSQTCIEAARQHDFSSMQMAPHDYVDMLFGSINLKLIELSQESHQQLFGTIIIGVLDEDTLTVTTYGDSPVYLFTDRKIKRLAKNQKRYEDLIEQGYINRSEYEGYLKYMHERMRSCFDRFLPEIVPNNIVEQHAVKQGDMLVMCSDGLSDWIMPNTIFSVLLDSGVEQGTNDLMIKAKDTALASQGYFDDITAISVSFWQN